MTKRRSYLRRLASPVLLIAACILVRMTLQRLRQQNIDQKLIAAVKDGTTSLAVSLLNGGADANAREIPADTRPLLWKLWNILQGSAPQLGDETALLLAVDPNPYDNNRVPENVPMAEALLNHGADVNASDFDGTTPLISAAQRSMTDLASLFLDRGASVDARDDNGSTAAMQAVDIQIPSVLEFLLTRGTNVNARDDSDASLLQSAIPIQGSAIVQMLSKYGADVNSTGSDGSSPLKDAVTLGNVDDVRLLIAAGAKVEEKAPDAISPLEVATDFHEIEIVKILKNAGAKRRLCIRSIGGSM